LAQESILSNGSSHQRLKPWLLGDVIDVQAAVVIAASAYVTHKNRDRGIITPRFFFSMRNFSPKLANVAPRLVQTHHNHHINGFDSVWFLFRGEHLSR
jgi:hypothetical protein